MKYLLLLPALMFVMAGCLNSKEASRSNKSPSITQSEESPPEWAYDLVYKYMVEKINEQYVNKYFVLQEAKTIPRSQLDTGFIPPDLEELYCFTYEYKHPYRTVNNKKGLDDTFTLNVYPDGKLIPTTSLPTRIINFDISEEEALKIARDSGLRSPAYVVYKGVWDIDSDPWYINDEGQLRPSKYEWRDYILIVFSDQIVTLPGGSRYSPAVYLRADTGEVIATNLISKASLEVINSFKR